MGWFAFQVVGKDKALRRGLFGSRFVWKVVSRSLAGRAAKLLSSRLNRHRRSSAEQPAVVSERLGIVLKTPVIDSGRWGAGLAATSGTKTAKSVVVVWRMGYLAPLCRNSGTSFPFFT
jgi:hypothetical protein